MAPPPIRIRIGASVDSSLDSAFKTAVSKALGAENAIRRGKRETTTAAETEAKRELRAQERAVKAVEALDRQRARGLFQQYRQQEAAAEKASKAEIRAREHTEQTARREIEKTTRAMAAALEREERAQERAASRAGERFARRTSYRAARSIGSLVSSAGGVVRDITTGLGIDTSLSGSIARGVNIESLATQLSNQGYRRGEKGPAGVRVDSATLQAEARSVGGALRLDPAELLKAQTRFVDITGNLDEARKNMKGLAEIAASTGTDFVAMSEAAGNIARHLDEGPDKAERLQAIMRVMAGQGKVGSIEIKNFAMQMAKIAALAPRFSGDTSSNITKLTTLAQLSRAEGGSATAAQAATAVARFTDTFSTPARIKGFDALHISTYERNLVNGKQVNSKLRDPFEIIKDSLSKTHGDALAMSNLFKSVMSKRAVDALTNAYNGAGGGKAGLHEVDKQIAIFGKESAITPEEVVENNAKRQATRQAKAQDFQNKLDKIVNETADRLIPALEQLEEPALKVAKALAGLAQSASDHMWTAVGLAIAGAVAASVGKGALEASFRAVVEGMINRGGSGGGAGGGGGGFMAGGGLGMRNGAWKSNALVGAAATAGAAMAWGAAEDQNEQLKKESGGMGVLDIAWNSLSTGRSPFKVIDENANNKAREEAAARAASPLANASDANATTTGGATAISPMVDQVKADNALLRQELDHARQVQVQMLGELRRLNIPPPATGTKDWFAPGTVTQ